MITKETNEMLNRLLQQLFDGNAIIDNLVYNLESDEYARLAEAIHEPVAHILTNWADDVTGLIKLLGGRAVRYGCDDHTDKVEPEQVFSNISAYFDELRKNVCDIIDTLDMSEDVEARVFMEDFLNRCVMPYNKQTKEWVKQLGMIGVNQFNLHIDDYTHFIK